MMDPEIIAVEACQLTIPECIESTHQLDDATTSLTVQLTRIADTLTPKRKASYRMGEQWWDLEVDRAVRKTRRARRFYSAQPSDYNWRQLQDATSIQQCTIRDAKTKSWRRALTGASKDSRKIWSLAKWARLCNYTPPEPLILPPLLLQLGSGEPPATTHEEKAELLGHRFFPEVQADLSDVQLDLQNDDYQAFTLDQDVIQDEIASILRSTGVWKAPGPDLLPVGFLKACRPLLASALANIAAASLRLSYLPSQLQAAKVVVIPKPGKTVQ